jgi:hypothetical protein
MRDVDQADVSSWSAKQARNGLSLSRQQLMQNSTSSAVHGLLLTNHS